MNPFLSQIQAFAKIVGGVFAITTARGCTATKTGVGDYNVTLDRGADVTQCAAVGVNATADQSIYVVHTSDTVKQVLIRTIAGVPAAADGNFDFLLFRLV